MRTFVDTCIFAAPSPTYSKETFKKHLVWIPWNEAVSPDRVDDEKYAEGIPCMWLPAPRAAGVILFCHANAEDLGMCFAFVRHMRDQFKMNVLAIEYPGYGLLPGPPTTSEACKEVALTVFRFIIDELKVAYEQIILFGRSVGSGPTIYLASRFPVGGLILVAGLISIKEAAKHLVGDLLALFVEERFPNVSLIGNVSCPTLFIHGEKDIMIPPRHSVALFKQCRARKLLITPPGMEHNTNLFTDAQFLAVPAINFFGLPGYQQETPPQMPTRFFEDGRQQFIQRRASNRGQPKKEGAMVSESSPWFFLCGCPTSRARNRDSTAMEPQMERPRCDWDPDGLADSSLEAGAPRSIAGDPAATAARDTAASAAANSRTNALQGGDKAHGIGRWGGLQDFHEEEITDKLSVA